MQSVFRKDLSRGKEAKKLMIRTKTKDGGYGFFALRAPWNDQLKIKKKLETNDQKSEWYF